MDETPRGSAPPSAAAEAASAARAREARPQLPQAVGTLLRGRYRLTGVLEVNQVGTLYRAEVVETGRTVAVKVFQAIGRHERNRIEGFHRPARRGVPRPELPSAFAAVYECDLTDDGRLFLVTELLEGPTVADLLRRTPPLGPMRALDLAMRVGEALEGVLNLGLLDLRVAPGDVIVPHDGDRVRLHGSDRLILRRLGLGESLATAEATERDPRYASPEELAGLRATERSVVHRYGILLYELLAGHPPFPGTTAGEVHYRQLQPLRSRLRDRHPGLPASVDQLVSRMLDHDPQARPGDLTWILNELWDAACRLRGETPAQPTDATSPRSAGFKPRRRPARTRGWALAALPVLVLGGVLLAWPHLLGPLTGRTSGPNHARPAGDPAPPPMPPVAVTAPELPLPSSSSANVLASTRGPDLPPALLPPAVLPPALSVPAREGSAPPEVGRAGSSPRVRSRAPGVAQPETPPAPASARVANSPGGPIPERVAPPAPPEAPASRRAATPIEPDTTSPRAGPTPPPQPATTVTPPPVRPSESPPDPRGDPGAIIEWLVRESPRISE